jgi:hypothetical protein
MIKAQAQQASDAAKAQQEMQVLQMKSQVDAGLAEGKAAADMQVEQFKANVQIEIERMRLQHDEALKAQQDALERFKAELAAQKDIQIASINFDIQTQDIQRKSIMEQERALLDQQKHDATIAAMNKPKTVIRDETGRVVGVE